jgi:aryl carrier-like protein
MSAKNPVLYSGNQKMPLDLVLQVMKLPDNYQVHDAISVIHDRPVEPLVDESLTAIRAMRHYRKLRRQGARIGFQQWISAFAQQITSNPLDRVYAYVGLSRIADETFPLSADYGKPVDVVWAESYRYILQRAGDLDVICQGRGPGRCEDLSLPHKRTQNRQSFELPSWVPDLTLPISKTESLEPLRVVGIFCAGNKVRRANVKFEGDLKGFQNLKRIRAAGAEVDFISAVTTINQIKVDLRDDSKQEVSDTQRFISEATHLCWGYKMRMEMEANIGVESNSQNPTTNGPLEALKQGIDYHGFGYTWLKALGKTLMMDFTLDLRRLGPQEDFWNMPEVPPAYFRARHRDLEENKKLWKEALHVSRHQWTIGRKFFITRKGYMGVGPPNAACLDMVCILDGATFPFVLRKSIADEGETWEFLDEW